IRSGEVGAALLAANTLPRNANSNPLGRPIGIQLYAVNSAMQENPAGTLKQLREIGFGEVETAGFGKRSAKEFRKLLDDAGLACPSAHLQFDVDNLGPTFEDAHALGVQYVTSGGLRSGLRPPITGLASGMNLDEAKRTAALANQIGDKARQAGLQYAYHNHAVEFADQGGAIGYDVLLRETNPDLVKVEIDCGWMVVGGRNPIDYFKKYPNRFPMIHVKDFLPPHDKGADGGNASAHPGAELGHGIIDYKPIFAAAEKAGLQHYFAEQEGPFARMSQLQAAQQAYAYLHPIS
ncbi:MAG TPA: sugar phosphate isomerase/epimerase, partial [Steroidobacteraceae bacterium]